MWYQFGGICSVVSSQSTRVTEGQTEGVAEGQTELRLPIQRYSIAASRGKNWRPIRSSDFSVKITSVWWLFYQTNLFIIFEHAACMKYTFINRNYLDTNHSSRHFAVCNLHSHCMKHLHPATAPERAGSGCRSRHGVVRVRWGTSVVYANSF